MPDHADLVDEIAGGSVRIWMLDIQRRGFEERSHSAYQDGLAVFDFHEHDEAWDRLDADDPLMEVAGRWLEIHRDLVISAIEATSAL